MIIKKNNQEYGDTYHLKLEKNDIHSYLVFLPRNWNRNSRILVCVHGISRNFNTQIQLLKYQAFKNQTVLIAPYFSKDYHPSFQRHELGVDNLRSDIVLNYILDDVKERFSINTQTFMLFGYSAGAQFSHRYALRYPKRVSKLVVCSSGWYTFLDFDTEFPLGVDNSKDKNFILDNKIENVKNFLKIPITIAIGEEDNILDSSLNKTRLINETQGYTRIERAIRWTKSLHKTSQVLNIESSIDFILLPKSGHSFSECIRLGKLDRHIFA